MDDADLVRATRSGDVAAFTTIFDRHAARVHDLALAMLRDRGVALEVVESTFLEASLRLQALEEGYRLPVWILAVTRRNAALRAGPTAGVDRQPSLPNDDPQRVQLAGLVWEAVADLPLRDRTLFDLELRQGLDGLDLADALGVTLTQAQELQGRMRGRMEAGLSAYLVARTADGRCPGLTKVLKGWDSKFAPKSSKKIVDHVEGCRVCTQARFAFPSPLALYAAALPAPFPAAVRSRVIDRVVLPASGAGQGVGAPVPVPGSATVATAAYQSPMARPSSQPAAAPAPPAGWEAERSPFQAPPAPSYQVPPVTVPVQAQPPSPAVPQWPPAPAAPGPIGSPEPAPGPASYPTSPYPVTSSPPPEPPAPPSPASEPPPDAAAPPSPSSIPEPSPSPPLEPSSYPPSSPPGPAPEAHAPMPYPAPEPEPASHEATPYSPPEVEAPSGSPLSYPEQPPAGSAIPASEGQAPEPEAGPSSHSAPSGPAAPPAPEPTPSHSGAPSAPGDTSPPPVRPQETP